VGGALDDDRLAAQPAHGLGHLDADRAAAEDDQPARDRLHPGHLAVGPHAVELAQAGHGRDERRGAVGEHDVLGGVALAVDLDDAGPGQATGPAQQVDAAVGQEALLARVGVVRHLEVAPGQRALDVDLRARGRLARLVHRLARAQQRLGRDARPVRALAADELALDDGDPQAAVRQRRGAMLPRRAAAEDDDVVVVGVAHDAAPTSSHVRPSTDPGAGAVTRWPKMIDASSRQSSDP
jgi:hypothetical protein